MRLVVEALPGELAGAPGEALTALADAAELDGADPSTWLEKALHSHGATHREAEVDATPRHRAAADATDRAVRVYRNAMAACREAVRERLERAAREANLSDLLEEP